MENLKYYCMYVKNTMLSSKNGMQVPLYLPKRQDFCSLLLLHHPQMLMEWKARLDYSITTEFWWW